MLRDWRMYLDDILSSAARIADYTQGMRQADLLRDNKTYDAVIRNLEIIGEAVKHVPDEIRANMPEINWRGAAGLRDMLAHEYFGIDDDILWDVIVNKVPELQDKIRNHENIRRNTE